MAQVFKGAKGAVLEELRKSGAIPGEANGVKGADSTKKKKRPDKGVSCATHIVECGNG